MGNLVSCFSNILYLSEKISLWLTCTSLICCLVLTITATLGMGIGLGYNYCFVGVKNRVRTYVKGHWVYPGDPRWRPPNERPQKREGVARDYQDIEELSENDAYRTPTQLSDDAYIFNDYPSQRSPSEDLLFDNPSSTGETLQHYNETIDYDPGFSVLESSNGTESSLESTVEVATNVESTEISESRTTFRNETSVTVERRDAVAELNSTTSSFSESSSTNVTAGTTEGKTENIKVTNEPPPEPADEPTTPIVNDPSSRKVKKLVIPITGLDLISLLSKLSAENKNYSLQIVTT